MQKLVINGGKPLCGEVFTGGAKNAALPIIAATLLANGHFCINNIPKLRDIDTLGKLLKELGVITKSGEDKNTLCFFHEAGADIDALHDAPYELVNQMRASILVLGPLLAKRGRAHVSLPGGCAIGARPVDLHISALEKMGARINIEHGYIDASCDRLCGADITFSTVTVTGTENILMAAALAKGQTILRNAAKEPEVVDLANFLNAMGAKIEGIGTSTLIIDGVDELHATDYSVMPDRIEAGTLMCAIAATGGDGVVKNVPLEAMGAVIEHLQLMGVTVTTLGESSVKISCNGRLNAIDIVTAPYPGFPTDMQAQFMALMARANGVSTVNETIFENRFMHVPELNRMGANIEIDEHMAIVHGVDELSGAPVMASDLRASASLVIAGLVASGVSEVLRVYHLDRGYESFEMKLAGMGADIARVHYDE